MHTKKQIEACLKQFLNKEEISKYEIEVFSDLCKGSNYLGEVRNVKIKGYKNGEEVIYTFIAKIARTDEGFRKCFSVKDLVEHEMFMYHSIFPQFKKILEEQNVVENICLFPEMYVFSNDESTETIILENMTSKGYNTYDRQGTLDYNHALIILKQLGRFHALSFAMQEYYPSIFQDFCNKLFDVEFHGELGKTIEMLIAHRLPECIQLFDPVKEEVIYNQVSKFQNTLFKNVQSKVTANAAKPYAVVGHGDLWITNMLFKYNEASVPTEACFIDFQLSKVYSPACDISQIMFACLDEHVRKKYYDHLVEEYYKSLSLFLKKLGCDPDKLFPYHILQEHLKNFSMIGVSTAIRMVHLVSVSSEETPDFHLAENGLAAVQMMLQSKKDPKLFDARMKNVILDYINYGYNL